VADRSGTFKREFGVVTLRLRREETRISQWYEDGRLAFDVNALPGDPKGGSVKFVDERTKSRENVRTLLGDKKRYDEQKLFLEAYRSVSPDDPDIAVWGAELAELESHISIESHLSGLASCVYSSNGNSVVVYLNDPDKTILEKIDPNIIVPLWVARIDDVDPTDRVTHMAQCPLGWVSPPISRAGTGSHAVIVVGHSVDFRVVSHEGVLWEVVAMHVSGATARCYPITSSIVVRGGGSGDGGRNGGNGNGRLKAHRSDPPATSHLGTADDGESSKGGNGKHKPDDAALNGVPITDEPKTEPTTVAVAVDEPANS